MMALSMTWWVLSKSDTPLSHAQVQGRIRSNFGDLVMFKDKLTTTSIKFFNDEFMSVDKSGKVHLFSCEDIPFYQALRQKFLDVLLS